MDRFGGGGTNGVLREAARVRGRSKAVRVRRKGEGWGEEENVMEGWERGKERPGRRKPELKGSEVKLWGRTSQGRKGIL